MTRTQLLRRRKKNAPATARAVSQGEEAAPVGKGGFSAAGEDDDVPMKGIGEVARAIVERLAARRRDAQPDAPDLADLEN